MIDIGKGRKECSMKALAKFLAGGAIGLLYDCLFYKTDAAH